ncbi:MAG: HAD hydrolase family protein [Candidatus Accumulibacter sp.]|jgi:YrbI family 3-deoxy-D-manno-octulosonate 8-phosphate phosphatase|nr:HAD hydrolase family protein [Accumulibacter sp.]
MKLILADIDGVLTDGRVTLDVHGNETKSICYRDLDAIGIGRRNGYDFAFVTGEDTEMARTIAKRFNVERIYTGAKDKLSAIKTIAAESGVDIHALLYIGDNDSDVPALEAVGIGIAPRDATPGARNAANFITESGGGHGVLLEVVGGLMAGKLKFQTE